VVTNIPRPYRRALFGVLKEQLAAEGLLLRVLYTSNPSKHARRGPTSSIVDDPEVESYVHGVTFRLGFERVITLPTGLSRMLTRNKPVCVVAAGFGPSAGASARWCRAANVPCVLWSGGWPGGERKLGRFRILNRKGLVRNAKAFVTYGTAAAEYLTTLGAPSDRIFCAWNTVDLEGITSAARAAAASRAELAKRYSLAAKNLLFVGSLIERKGVQELVSAALSAEPRDQRWALHLVGGGPLRDELEATVLTAGRETNFRFHGLLPAKNVAELLGVADGFILPTKEEIWGLVINEAMACGVPVVTSPWAGATRDLIEDGISGYVVEPTDTAALAAIMSRLLTDDPRCKEVGRKGAEVVRARASLERSAEGFVSAVKCAIAGPE
jgi:glycosyltransferase involved in cell wall biosynthesis